MNFFRKILRSKMHDKKGDINNILFKEYKIPINNIEISVLETKKQAKKTLLLMPGLLGSKWTSFGPQIKDLPILLPEYKIVAWDPPGCGSSIPPERKFCLHLFRNDAHLAVELMNALKCDSYSVLGWSEGGVAALIMAGRFPEYIEKLVVWGSGAFITEHEMNKLKASTSRGLGRLPLDYRSKLEKLYGSERLAEMWKHWTNLLCDFKTKHKGDLCSTEVDCIQAPTLILRGSEDHITDPEHIKFLRKHIKSSKFFELPEAGFEMHLTHAAEFNKLVAKFLLEKPT